MKWISVKERLPKINEYVILWQDYNDDCEGLTIIIGMLDREYSNPNKLLWHLPGCGEESLEKFKYWMPLPEKPE